MKSQGRSGSAAHLQRYPTLSTVIWTITTRNAINGIWQSFRLTSFTSFARPANIQFRSAIRLWFPYQKSLPVRLDRNVFLAQLIGAKPSRMKIDAPIPTVEGRFPKCFVHSFEWTAASSRLNYLDTHETGRVKAAAGEAPADALTRLVSCVTHS